VVLCLAAIAGCQPAPEATYVANRALTDFPIKGLTDLPTEKMSALEKGWARDQAAWTDETLRDYFGTPQHPRRKVVGPIAEGSDFPALRTLASLVPPPADGAAAEAHAAQLRQERRELAQLERGAAVFQHYCHQCHGVTGDGAGPAAAGMLPLPRDYRLGIFKFTSTGRGAPPRREDLARIIRLGAKGTAMPSFRFMEPEELAAVVEYVVHLSQRGQFENQLFDLVSSTMLDGLPAEEDEFKQWNKETWLPTRQAEAAKRYASILQSWREASGKIVMPLTVEPPYTEDSVRLGRDAFLARGCAKCHGEDGRGRTQDNVGQDAWGHKTNAADLTSGMLHGGRRSIDLYRRIYAGINGTPMPSFSDALKEEPDTFWHLVHYVQALSRRDAALAKLPKPASPAPMTPPTPPSGESE
jgi:mono/diheme cytochrome c family protein